MTFTLPRTLASEHACARMGEGRDSINPKCNFIYSILSWDSICRRAPFNLYYTSLFFILFLSLSFSLYVKRLISYRAIRSRPRPPSLARTLPLPLLLLHSARVSRLFPTVSSHLPNNLPTYLPTYPLHRLDSIHFSPKSNSRWATSLASFIYLFRLAFPNMSESARSRMMNGLIRFSR